MQVSEGDRKEVFDEVIEKLKQRREKDAKHARPEKEDDKGKDKKRHKKDRHSEKDKEDSPEHKHRHKSSKR